MHVDKTSTINRNWLLGAARGTAKPIAVGSQDFRLAPARLVFPFLTEPKKIPPQNPGDSVKFKYQALFVFPWELSLEECFGPALETANQMAKVPFGDQWLSNKKISKPFAEQGETTDKKGQLWTGLNPTGYCFNGTSINPVLMTRTDGSAVNSTQDQTTLFRAGNWVLPVVRPVIYNLTQNSGISFFLNGVIFLAEDRQLGGAPVDMGAAAQGLSGLEPPPLAQIHSTPFD